MQLLFPILLVVLMYVLLVRPQQQRARRQRDLVSSLQIGAEVQTAGGLMGRIVGLDDELVRIEAAPGVVLTFVRGAIARVVEVEEPPEEDAAAAGGPDHDWVAPAGSEADAPTPPGDAHPGGEETRQRPPAIERGDDEEAG